MKKEIRKYYKPNDFRGIFLRIYYRYMGIRIAQVLSKTKITPNQITIFRTLLLFPMMYLLYSKHLIISAILILLIEVLDFADGSLARMTNRSSKLGHWLEYSDKLFVPLVFLSIGLSYGILLPAFLATITYKYLDDLLSGYTIIYGDGLTGNLIKNKISGNLFFSSHFIVSIIIIACLINQLILTTYLLSIYGILSSFLGFVIFYRKADRQKT